MLVTISDRPDYFPILNMVVCIVILLYQIIHSTNRVDAWRVLVMMSGVVLRFSNDGVCLLEIEATVSSKWLTSARNFSTSRFGSLLMALIAGAASSMV